MMVCNSLALKLAGITKDTPAPPGGVIVKDAAGEPTGVLKDAAMDLVGKVRPPRTKAEVVEGLRAAVQHAAKNGVTSVQDLPGTCPGSGGLGRAPQRGRADRAGQLPALALRLAGREGRADVDEAGRVAQGRRREGLHGRRARRRHRRDVRGVLRRSGQHGPLRGRGHSARRRSRSGSPEPTPPASRSRSTRSATRRSPSSSTSSRASRRRTVRRTGASGSSTPSTCAAPRSRASPSRASSPRCSRTTPWTTGGGPTGGWAEASAASAPMRSGGCSTKKRPLAFGSDWDVAPLSPILGIAAAVTRATIDGKQPGGWVPEQKIRPEEALRAYTSSAAYAGLRGEGKGLARDRKARGFRSPLRRRAGRAPRGDREDPGRHDGRGRPGRLSPLAARRRPCAAFSRSSSSRCPRRPPPTSSARSASSAQFRKDGTYVVEAIVDRQHLPPGFGARRTIDPRFGKIEDLTPELEAARRGLIAASINGVHVAFDGREVAPQCLDRRARRAAPPRPRPPS